MEKKGGECRYIRRKVEIGMKQGKGKSPDENRMWEYGGRK